MWQFLNGYNIFAIAKYLGSLAPWTPRSRSDQKKPDSPEHQIADKKVKAWLEVACEDEPEAS